jgi:transposase
MEKTVQEKQRRHFSNQEKVAILKRHLVDRVAVSDLCDEYRLAPTQLYRWQQQFFEQGAAAFERGRTRDGAKANSGDAKIAQLEAKLQRKDAVLGEVMEEFILLKKELGAA